MSRSARTYWHKVRSEGGVAVDMTFALGAHWAQNGCAIERERFCETGMA